MISVCMATYNGAKTVETQLASILPQLSSEDEVIVVDDGSADNTLNLIETLAQGYPAKLSIHKNMVNTGPVKAFETALKQAKGDYIFLSDQDDEWFPKKVQMVMEVFQDSNASLVVHDGVVVDKNKKELDSSWNHFNRNNVHQGVIGNIIKNGFTGAMMAFTKELVQASLPFPEKLEMHDQRLFLVAKKKGMKVSVIEAPLMYYVRHGDNVTGNRRSFGQQLAGRIRTIRQYLDLKK